MASSAKKHKAAGNEDSISFTAHTYLPDIPVNNNKGTLYLVLDDMGDWYGRVKRALFRDCMSKKRNPVFFKNDYLKQYEITSRQFNALRYDLEGEIKSAAECLKLNISNLTDKIRSMKKWIRSKEAKIRKIKADADLPRIERKQEVELLQRAVDGKKEKLDRSEVKLKSLSADLESGRIRLCFGTKKLFHKQFNLEENGYAEHSEWLSDWQHARSSQTFCLGSKDETAGNQSCTLFKNGMLRLRVPNKLVAVYGKYITIPNVGYPYGQEIIDQALHLGQALTHRFVRGEKGWYLHTTVDIKNVPIVTLRPGLIGCLGVDVNEKNITVTETDRFGNYVWSKLYPACVKDRSSDQTVATYGDICAEITARAIRTGKPIGHERLDFTKKKASMKEQGVRYGRMLSGFAYASFLTMLDRKAFKCGVEVFSVNPAYTSVIGRHNYASRYGISYHEAAALAIARRVQRYSEAPVTSSHADPLPVRNRGERDWTYWSRVSRIDKAREHDRKPSSSKRRPLQRSSGCAEPQPIYLHGTTAQTTRPPTGDFGPLDIDTAPVAFPFPVVLVGT
jgi:IS605 OrfB family transposase